jgi:hypothetical protein
MSTLPKAVDAPITFRVPVGPSFWERGATQQ